MLFGLDSVAELELEERRRAKLFSDQRVTSEWRSLSAAVCFLAKCADGALFQNHQHGTWGHCHWQK